MLLLFLGLASGCASIDTGFDDSKREELINTVLGNVPIEPDAPILVLDPEVKAKLDERIGSTSDRNKLTQLRLFLFDENELALRYQADNTRTAMEIWESRAGNCLSLTNLFIAAARHVGLDAHYKTVAIRPTWDHDGATMIRYEHIIATGQLSGGQEYVVDFLPEFVIGGRRSEQITDKQALALYFNNKGAEHIIAGDHGTAIENLRHALTLNPRFGDAWNNLGAALRREGQLKLAEYAYQYAIEIDANNFSAMNNLAQFYVSQGREVEAIDIGKRVARYRQRNPYFLYFIAQRFYEQGRWDEAITLLERSVALKRDEPDFYEAIATSYDQLGNEQQRDEYLALARQYREAVGIRNVPRERGHRFWIQTLNIN